MVAGSSPTLRSGSILKVAPCSSPTSRSLFCWLSMLSLLADREKAMTYLLATEVAGRTAAEARAKVAAAGRRARREEAIVVAGCLFV